MFLIWLYNYIYSKYILSFSQDKSCVVVEHVLYANQNKPSLLVQEVIINNHAVSKL